MPEFDDIRAYRDEEIRPAVDRLLASDGFLTAAGALMLPRLTHFLPQLARALVRRRLRARLDACDDIDSLQRVVAERLESLVSNTTDGFTVGGLATLPKEVTPLFVANHRDIAMDSSLLNLALVRGGRRTCRVAVGSNLFDEPFVADIIRANKGFVVPRETKGAKETYRALLTTSGYVRESLEAGEPVWIAQAEGRAKDGLDRTEPALLKMLMLAYRDEIDEVGDFLSRVCVVPVTVSYEFDPCDAAKARELRALEQSGCYEKRPGEDLDNLALGLNGDKGHVHLQVGQRLIGDFANADEAAAMLDAEVARGLRIFPSHIVAAREMGVANGDDVDAQGAARFRARVARIEPSLRPYLLRQYANLYQAAIGAGSGR